MSTRFGQIDIYLFDQLLRGRLAPGMRVLDAGCGARPQSVYLLREGTKSSAPMATARRLRHVQQLAARWRRRCRPKIPGRADRAMTFPDGLADVVLSSAVLHFARDDEQFDGDAAEMWRVLKPGGMLFCRLASTIGMESACIRRRPPLPAAGWSERYLVDEAMLLRPDPRFGGSCSIR